MRLKKLNSKLTLLKTSVSYSPYLHLNDRQRLAMKWVELYQCQMREENIKKLQPEDKLITRKLLPGHYTFVELNDDNTTPFTGKEDPRIKLPLFKVVAPDGYEQIASYRFFKFAPSIAGKST